MHIQNAVQVLNHHGRRELRFPTLLLNHKNHSSDNNEKGAVFTPRLGFKLVEIESACHLPRWMAFYLNLKVPKIEILYHFLKLKD